MQAHYFAWTDKGQNLTQYFPVGFLFPVLPKVSHDDPTGYQQPSEHPEEPSIRIDPAFYASHLYGN